MKLTNEVKRNLKQQMVDAIQKLRRLAEDYANEGDGKSETDCYDRANKIRQTMYHFGFETKAYAGGISPVCGITIEVVAHRNAKWEKVAEELGLNF